MNIIDLDKNFTVKDNHLIALGNFDGLHIAHMEIINSMINEGKITDNLSSVLLFKDHPSSLLGNEELVLTSLEDKLSILEDTDLDTVFLISFAKLRSLSKDKFLEFLVNTLKVQGIFVGFDYRYGYKGEGDTETLLADSKEKKVNICIHDPILSNSEIISSTKIRKLIIDNKLKEGERLLGHEYWLSGEVVKGKGLGKEFGFPTANIKLDTNYAIPKEGVYLAQVLLDNNLYFSATSMGQNITFDELDYKIESHIIDFDDNIYGKKIKIRPLKRLRPMKRFDNIDELIDQVLKDIENCKKEMDNYGNQ